MIKNKVHYCWFFTWSLQSLVDLNACVCQPPMSFLYPSSNGKIMDFHSQTLKDWIKTEINQIKALHYTGEKMKAPMSFCFGIHFILWFKAGDLFQDSWKILVLNLVFCIKSGSWQCHGRSKSVINRVSLIELGLKKLSICVHCVYSW